MMFEYELTALNGALYLYAGAVAVSGTFGLLKSLESWMKYMAKRERIPIKNLGEMSSLIEGIVNCAKDAGVLCGNMVTYTGVSMLVAATFPVSVPLIVYTSGKKGKKEADD